MKIQSILCIALISFTSCGVKRAIYTSPFNANNITYHAIPLVKDSVRSAIYFNSNIYLGSANSTSKDHVTAFNVSMHRTNQIGKQFQAYYAVNLCVGDYKVAGYGFQNISHTVNPQVINSFAGHKTFTGLGVAGGINAAFTKKRGEFRIGTEFSSNRDYGSYYGFRKAIPDSAVTFVARNSSFSTLGLYVDINHIVRDRSFGVRIGAGAVLESQYGDLYLSQLSSPEQVIFKYINVAVHYTVQDLTGFVQLCNGTKAFGGNVGMNYCIPALKRPGKKVNKGV